MTAGFWIKRFLVALVVAWAVLFVAHLLRGHAAPGAVAFAALWGTLAAALFTLLGYLKYRRHPACMLPRQRQP